MSTKQTEFKDKLVYQCSKGFRQRHVQARQLDSLAGPATEYRGIFIAPCACRILRASVNARTYPNYATSTVATFYKGGGTALTSALDIDDKTAETEQEATLSTTSGALNLTVGQIVYVKIVSTGAETSAGADIITQVEWMPTES